MYRVTFYCNQTLFVWCFQGLKTDSLFHAVPDLNDNSIFTVKFSLSKKQRRFFFQGGKELSNAFFEIQFFFNCSWLKCPVNYFMWVLVLIFTISRVLFFLVLHQLCNASGSLESMLLKHMQFKSVQVYFGSPFFLPWSAFSQLVGICRTCHILSIEVAATAAVPKASRVGNSFCKLFM